MKNWIDWLNTMIEFTVVAEFFFLFSATRVFRKKRVILYGVASLIFSSIIAFFHLQILPVNFSMFILATFILIYDMPFIDGIVCVCSAFLCALFLEMTFDSLLPITLLHTDYGNLIANTVMLCCSSFLWIFCKKRNSDIPISRLIQRYRIPVLLILLFSSILGQIYVLQLSVFWTYLPGVIAVLLVFMVVFSLVLYVHYSKQAYAAKEELYQKNIATTEMIIDSYRTQIHNNKAHLDHLSGIINTSPSLTSAKEQVNNYLGHLRQSQETSSLIYSIEDPLLRAVLYGAYANCVEKDIDFRLEMSPLLPSFPLKDFELVEVVDNLIANAIDSTVTNKDNRSITIRLIADAYTNHLAVLNYYSGVAPDTSLILQKGFSTKSGSHLGFGLSSITEILKPYHMVLNCEVDVAVQQICFSFEYLQPQYGDE